MNKNYKLLILVLVLFSGTLETLAQSVANGPVQLRLRVNQLYQRDYEDLVAAAEESAIVWFRDNANLDGNDWVGGSCYQYGANEGSYPLWSPTYNDEIFNVIYGTNVPNFYQVRIDAWEDDRGDRCSYDGSCFICDADDVRCGPTQIGGDNNFRNAGPPCNWNETEVFGAGGNCDQYGIRVGSYYTPAVPSVTGTLTACGSVTLTASGATYGGSYLWFNAPSGGSQLFNGSSYTINTVGTQTVYVEINNGCPSLQRRAVTVTVNAPDNSTFNYGSTTYCQNGSNPTPTITGLSGGNFSSSPSGLVINGSGTINLAGSTPGTYTVSYTTTGTCPTTTNRTVTINAVGNSNFNYSSLAYCQNGSDPIPTISVSGGTFSFSPTGLNINSSNGTIDVSASAVNNYTVTYNSGGPCPTTTNRTVQIRATDNASFNYPSVSYCTNASNPSPNITGLPGGTFASGSGNLVVNPTSGIINLGASVAGGPYNVQYTTTGQCPNSSTVSISINAADNASFNYPAVSFCQNAPTNPNATITGLAGGSFNSTPSGLSLNGNNGTIDLASSTPSVTPYVVTYQTTGICPNTFTRNVTIIAPDNSSFAYADNTICVNTPNPSPNIAGLTGGTFGSSPSGLSLNASSGLINLGSSTINQPFTVNYTTNGACPTTSSQSIIILPQPIVSFSGLTSAYCINNTTPVQLNGSPSGGTFNGLGVIGSTFTPSLTVTGSQQITYNFTDGNGCSNSNTQSVQINGLPFVSVSGLAPSYCVSNTTPIGLSLSPSGGLLAGNGVSGTNFTPSVAGIGFQTVNYTFTDANNCTNTAQISTNVNALPTVAISGLVPSYCTSSPNVTLTGIPNGGTFSGTGVSGTTFSPSTAGNGSFVVTYNYTDGNNCSNSTTQNVTVNTLPTVSFTGLNPSYCADAGTVNLAGSPAGGTFSGNGVSGNQFVPTLVSGNNSTVTYNYTDGNGCANSSSQTVSINTLPTVSFSGLASAYCISSPAVTLLGSPTGGSFSGTGVSGSNFDPAVAGLGQHTVSYFYTDGNGCSKQVNQTVVVNALPQVTISNLAAAYCVSSPSVALTGVPSGGSFSGTGVSGTTFSPSIAGNGTFTVTYNFTDGNSCSNSTTQSVIVNTLPAVSITGLNSAFCADASPVNLVGSPAGGTFSGNGVSGNQFIPSIVTGNNSTITYNYSDGNGCANTTTQTVSINTLPTVSITGLASAYCVNSPIAVLQGSPNGGLFSGTGVSAGNFDPSVAGVGQHTVSYFYTDGNGCSKQVNQTVVVNPLPLVAISNLAPAYCVDAPVASMTGIPAGGTFNGFGVTGNNFNPAQAGIGQPSVTYTYTDGNSCTNTTSQTVTVNGLPQLAILGLSPSYCSDAPAVTVSGLPTGGTFSGTGVSGNQFIPQLVGQGIVNIDYSYTDGNGCSNITTVAVQVNTLPTVAFSGLNSSYCVGNFTPVALTGAPSGGTFNGPGVSGTTFTPSSAGVGTHNVSYSFTDLNGCSNSIAQTVTVNNFPQVAITNLPNQLCINAPVQTLAGVPSGGLFSGTGVVGSSFNPQTAGVGTQTISYTFSDLNGCTNTAQQQITVYAQPTVNITGLASTYCVNNPQVTFTATPTGGTFSGPGVAGNTFIPSVAGTGTHTVSYTYTDVNNCSATGTQTVLVNAAPVPTITGLQSVYCATNQAVSVSVSPQGGTLAGNGISGTTFTPSSSNTGQNTITYNVTDGNGCSGQTSTTVTVNALPSVAIVGLNSTYCSTAPDDVIAGFPVGGTMSGPGITGFTFSPSSLPNGVINVNYTFTDGNSCTNTASQFVTINAAPNVSFSGLNATYCENATVSSLVGTPAGGTFAGQGVTGSNFDPSFAGSGQFDVIYSYNDINGCAGADTQTVFVNAIPTVLITGLNTVYCESAPIINLTGIPSGGTFSGNGVSNNQFDASAANLGNNAVNYSFTDGNGCTGNTTQNVVVNPLDNATFFYNQQSFCQSGVNNPLPNLVGLQGGVYSSTSGLSINAASGLITLNSSLVGPYIVTYTTNGACPNTATFNVNITNGANAGFNYGNNFICNNLTNPLPSITGDFGGSFSGSNGLVINPVTGEIDLGASAVGNNFTVTYTVGGACPGSATQTLSIAQADNADFDYPLFTYCQTSTQTPIPNVSGNLGGAFSGSNGLSISPTNGAINLLNSQQGTATITYTTNGVCPATQTQEVFINNGPVADITANGSTVFCNTGNVLLDAGPGYFSYQWSTNVNTQIINASQTGDYSVVVTDSSGCTSADTISVLVFNQPTAAFTFSNLNLTSNFFNLSDQGQSYQWNFGDGNTSTEVNPEHTYQNFGTYNVTLITTNICGSDTVVIEVKVIDASVTEMAAGISKLDIYPNPNSGMFTLEAEINAAKDVQLTIVDMTGRLITTENLTTVNGAINKTFDFNYIERGVYFVNLKTDKGNFSRRVVIN